MKKFFVIVATSTLILSGCGASKKSQLAMYQQPVSPQSSIASVVDDDPVTEWKREGFKMTGAMSTFSMRQALDYHNSKILSDRDRFVAVMGTSEGAGMKDLTSASLVAQNDAAIRYAQAAGSVISGGIGREFANFSEQGAKLMGAYTQKVSEYIMPLMKESFAIFKVDGEYYHVRTYYIIDEVSALKAREEAMDKALKETATEQVFGSSVNTWVKEFVKTE